MRSVRTHWPLPGAFIMVVAMAQGGSGQEPGRPPELPAARPIPGLTGDDVFPSACVSCHVRRPEENLDVRLSTIMRSWSERVDSVLLSRVRHTALEGMKLQGRHPRLAAEAFQNIPASCLECHGREAPEGPPFARMLHAIHLQGGPENHFLTLFQGECTHCHKLERATGRWFIPSGAEAQD